MKHFFWLLLCVLATTTLAQQPIGSFSSSHDIGNPRLSGSVSFDDQTQEYTLRGSGYNIWFERDEFHFLNSKIKGDFILTANVAFIGEGVDPHRFG